MKYIDINETFFYTNIHRCFLGLFKIIYFFTFVIFSLSASLIKKTKKLFLCVILLISCTLALLCFLNDLALKTWNHNWTLGGHFLSMVKQGRVGGFLSF